MPAASGSQAPSPSLPTWDQCRDAVDEGRASALEIFIFNNEPSSWPAAEGGKDDEWRAELLVVVKELKGTQP